jgi:hypothetical protein
MLTEKRQKEQVLLGRHWSDAYLILLTGRKVAGSRPDEVNEFFQFS